MYDQCPFCSAVVEGALVVTEAGLRCQKCLAAPPASIADAVRAHIRREEERAVVMRLIP